MKPNLESYMRDLIVRLEATERPDGSVFVTSPTYPLFSVVVQKSENVAQRAFDLLKQYMEINANRQFSLQAAEDGSALFDGVDNRPSIPAYVIAQAAA
jgi:hypothetical protein